jgi:hypothetical protein
MVFQLVQDSPWLMIFWVAEVVAILAVFIVLVLVNKNRDDDQKLSVLRRMFLVLAVCGLGCWIGMAAALHQQVAQNQVSFSKQLMDEYHATSSRSFSTIDHDSKPSNRTTTVLTRDGKDTPVSIQIVKRDEKEIMMAFHVLDDNSPYPTSGK